MTPEASARQMQASLAYDVSAQLDHIQPHPDHPRQARPTRAPKSARSLAQHINGVRLLLYLNAAHLVTIERADAINRDVLTFLAE